MDDFTASGAITRYYCLNQMSELNLVRAMAEINERARSKVMLGDLAKLMGCALNKWLSN
jgi:hypothetical protein